MRATGHRPWYTNSSYSQTTATHIKLSCLLKTLPTLYQQISSIETALSTLHQLNLLCSTHYAQWSTISCTHSSLEYYPEKVVKPLLQLTQDHLSTASTSVSTTDFIHRLRDSYRNSIQRAFTHATPKSCFFHYTECIWSKTQKLGLATAYRENDNVRLFIRRAVVLPLVPSELIEEAWSNALADSDEIAINISAFANYATEYWIEVNNRQQWNHFDNEGPRTNNHLEGWHGRLKKHLNHAHPNNIFVLIELLQKTQANTSKPDPDIGRRHATTHVKDIQKHLQQANNTQRFLQAELTVRDYTDIPSPRGNSTVV